MDDVGRGWSKNQRDWFWRIAKKSNQLSIRCTKRGKFYNNLAKKFVKANPDGIWRYVMIMSCGWMKCSEIWGDIADQFLAKVQEIDSGISINETDE